MEFKQFYFLFYRIFPFVLLSFFTLYSMIQKTMGGALLAIGALLTSIITAGLSQFEVIKTYVRGYREEKDPTLLNDNGKHILYSMAHCNILTLNNQIISNLPISTHILSFMVGYISYGFSLDANNYSVSTLLLSILFVFLLIDTVYNYLQCSGALVLIPLIIGGVCGWGWGAANGSSYVNAQTEKCDLNSTKKIYGCKMRGV